MAALSATAVAEDWFGLRQAALPQEGSGSGVEENVELLSLQGWFGSPEHQAAADWQDFLNHYDDGGALDAIGNGDTGLSERYLPYGVWTEEMAETLDAIAAKYNLALHQDNTIYDDTAAFLAVTGPFLDPALIYPGYAYPDGTFQCDGGWTAADGVSLLLAERLDGGHALILADRPESFVAVNILGTEQPLSREDLEAFAEGIDFSLL